MTLKDLDAMSKLTNDQMHDIAREFLRELGMPNKYVILFDCCDAVYLFDPTVGEPERVTPELHEKISAIERSRNVKIYAVTHDYIAELGETYSYLCVSPYEEDIEHLVRNTKDPTVKLVYAYVENILDEKCSEFGYIAVKSDYGSIVRVG